MLNYMFELKIESYSLEMIKNGVNIFIFFEFLVNFLEVKKKRMTRSDVFEIQVYPHRMRLIRRLYGIYPFSFLIFIIL